MEAEWAGVAGLGGKELRSTDRQLESIHGDVRCSIGNIVSSIAVTIM